MLAVEGSECTIKWQIEKKRSSHCITNVFLTAFHSIPSSDSASEAPSYLESDPDASDPKTSLHSAAQPNTQMPSDPAKLFQLISSQVPHAIHVSELHCVTALLIESLQPCMPTPRFVHFLRLSQSAQSFGSSSFVAETLFRGIIWCTKTSGFTSESGFSSTTHRVHYLANIFSCSSAALSKCLQLWVNIA